ncbi:hypothetical protein [Mycobacterium sp. OAE908]|uniref:hypothetical protein n=1 Tax=Mycobacterium sp. OAE908 TaxID=2817899 RepID=UPI001AE234B1
MKPVGAVRIPAAKEAQIEQTPSANTPDPAPSISPRNLPSGQMSYTNSSDVQNTTLSETPASPDPVAALVSVPAMFINTVISAITSYFESIVGPGAPFDNALLWGLMGWARRQTPEQQDANAGVLARTAVPTLALAGAPTGPNIFGMTVEDAVARDDIDLLAGNFVRSTLISQTPAVAVPPDPVVATYADRLTVDLPPTVHTYRIEFDRQTHAITSIQPLSFDEDLVHDQPYFYNPSTQNYDPVRPFEYIASTSDLPITTADDTDADGVPNESDPDYKPPTDPGGGDGGNGTPGDGTGQGPAPGNAEDSDTEKGIEAFNNVLGLVPVLGEIASAVTLVYDTAQLGAALGNCVGGAGCDQVSDEFGDIAGDLIGLLPFGRFVSPAASTLVGSAAGVAVDVISKGFGRFL